MFHSWNYCMHASKLFSNTLKKCGAFVNCHVLILDIKERQDSVNPQTAQVTEEPERENCQIPVNVRNG